jgi:deoxyribonuclease (pyrimidine dimer)
MGSEEKSTLFNFKHMTRINIIPVEELMDQHLIAEYREITMAPVILARTLSSKTGLDYKKISKSYTLNKGHVYFFYDKGFACLYDTNSWLLK